MKIIIAVGARPNFIKAAPLIKELKKYRKVKYWLVHTGQHYDKEMSDLFFKDLDIPKANINLGIGGGSQAEQTAGILTSFEKVCLKKKPDLVIVFGDVNSTLACALAAVKLNIKIAHIEAGLRSFDKSMPEEINRILTDHISDYLFVTEQAGVNNLIKEGVDKNKIFLKGNIMIDALCGILENKSDIVKKFDLKKYSLVTLHRPGNVDNRKELKKILDILEKISNKSQVVWPIHPRTKKNIENFKFGERLKKLLVLEPLGYLDFITMVRHAQLVLTDSGGIQAETTYLKIPCLTLRETTEQPETIFHGTNILADIRRAIDIEKKLADIKKRNYKIPKFWDGKTAERIVQVLLK